MGPLKISFFTKSPFGCLPKRIFFKEVQGSFGLFPKGMLYDLGHGRSVGRHSLKTHFQEMPARVFIRIHKRILVNVFHLFEPNVFRIRSNVGLSCECMQQDKAKRKYVCFFVMKILQCNFGGPVPQGLDTGICIGHKSGNAKVTQG